MSNSKVKPNIVFLDKILSYVYIMYVTLYKCSNPQQPSSPVVVLERSVQEAPHQGKMYLFHELTRFQTNPVDQSIYVVWCTFIWFTAMYVWKPTGTATPKPLRNAGSPCSLINTCKYKTSHGHSIFDIFPYKELICIYLHKVSGMPLYRPHNSPNVQNDYIQFAICLLKWQLIR